MTTFKLLWRVISRDYHFFTRRNWTHFKPENSYNQGKVSDMPNFTQGNAGHLGKLANSCKRGGSKKRFQLAMLVIGTPNSNIRL